MVDALVKYIESNQLFSPADTLLVGVSGGIDSVVLTDLLHHAGLAFAVAHCNFNLRGEDSDRDERFVKSIAARYNKPYFGKSFDTTGVASERGISIEMAARELRYTWFEEIRSANHFDWIVVGHHKDDQVETFFLNLARGTGISGLTGMSVVNGKVVRPLLFASRKEIETYAATQMLDFREDSTNSSTEFLRNKIRHLIIPLMEELNPAFRDRMQNTISHLRDASEIYSQGIARAGDQVSRLGVKGDFELSIAELKLLSPLETYLFELLKPYHFNSVVVEEMVKALGSQPGKMFYSATHRAIIDREKIIVHKLKENESNRSYLGEDCTGIDFPIKLSFLSRNRKDFPSLKTGLGTALVDKDKVQFPLILRRWQKGDYFQPLGMSGMKKLSDFFVDEKLSLPEKENTWILASGEEIVWIVGIRLDNRYKITNETENILVVQLYN